MNPPGLVTRLMGLDSEPVARCELLTKESNSKLTGSWREDSNNLHSKSSPRVNPKGPLLQKRLSPSTESRQIVSSQFSPGMRQSPSRKYQRKFLSPAKLLSSHSLGNNTLTDADAKVRDPGSQLMSRSESQHTRLGSLQVNRDIYGASIEQRKSAEGSRDSLVGICGSFKGSGKAGKQRLSGQDIDRSGCSEPKSSNGSSSHKGLEGHNKFKSRVTASALAPIQDRGNRRCSYTSGDRKGAASSSVAAKNNVQRRVHDNVAAKTDVRSNQLQNKLQESTVSRYPLKQNNLKQGKLPLANENISRSRQSRVPGQISLNESKGLISWKKTLNNDSCFRSKLKASSRVEVERVGLENKSTVRKGPSTINPHIENTHIVKPNPAPQRAMGKDLIISKGARLFNENPISPRSPRRTLRKQSELGENKSDTSYIVSFTFSSPVKRVPGSSSGKDNAEQGRSLADASGGDSHPKLMTLGADPTSSASGSEMTFERQAAGALMEMKSSELDQNEWANAKLRGDTKARIAAVFAGEDGDYPSPISTLRDSFIYDCFSRSSSGTPESQPDLDLKERQLSKTELKILEANLSYSALPRSIRKFNAENKPISNRFCSKKHGVSTFDVEIQKSKLRCSAEVTSHAELLLQNICPIDSDRRSASSISVFLHEAMESISESISTSLRGNFTEAKEGNWLRDLMMDSTIECLASIYNQLSNSGCRLWFKLLSLCTKDSLIAEIVKEVIGWNIVAGKPWESLVERDFDRCTEMWRVFWFHAFQIGMQIENDILQLLIDELMADFLHC